MPYVKAKCPCCKGTGKAKMGGDTFARVILGIGTLGMTEFLGPDECKKCDGKGWIKVWKEEVIKGEG